MNNPLISIIIPVYRVEEYLDQCVSSVISQSFNNFEIILVDDGSPDSCPAKCDAWAQKDSRIHAIHKTNEGLSIARNTGLKIAKGEYVWFVDSDDWISSQALSEFVKCIKLFKEVDLISMQLIGFENGKENIYGGYSSFPKCPTLLNNREYVDLNYGLYPVSRFIIRKKLLDDNNLFFIGRILHEDIPFGHMLISLVKQIVLLPVPSYYYRIRGGSIATSSNIHSCYSLILAHKIAISFIKKQILAKKQNWLWKLTYDYFHEIMIKLYPFIGSKMYDEFMKENQSYMHDEFNKLWHYLPLKRKILLLVFNVSPKAFSKLLMLKNRHS